MSDLALKPIVLVETKVWGNNSTIEPYKDAYWYRVYSDGWCEQGGCGSLYITLTRTVTFHKPFKDTNYYLGAGFIVADAGQLKITSKTTTGFTTTYGGKLTSANYWYACGYINMDEYKLPTEEQQTFTVWKRNS